jgi:hypothetical protein
MNLHELFPVDDLKYLAHIQTSEEVCGICLSGKRFIQTPNIAPNPTERFMIDRNLFDQYADETIAIFHTHIDPSVGSQLSTPDIETSRSLGVPYLLYHPLYDDWDYFDPLAIHPYPLEAAGTPMDLEYYTLWRFDYARSDCASVVRGWYKGRLGITLEDYPRIDLEESIEYRICQFNGDRLQENGFKTLSSDSTIQTHDILGMDLAGINQSHHLAVIVDAESNKILHNLGRDRYSQIDIYNQSWRSRTKEIYRHESQC